MNRPSKQRWYLRLLTFRFFRRAMWAILVVGGAAAAMILFASRAEQLRDKERQHALIARQLRIKAEVAAMLADADQRTDYVMAYHYSCLLLAENGFANLEESDASQRVQQAVRSVANFPASQSSRTPRQLQLASHSANLRIQAARHAETAATYRRAIWNPWTVTQDIRVEKDDLLEK